jgi:hypothetical protein
VQKNVLILHITPETFGKNIIQRTSLTIHTDSDLSVFEYLREPWRGELTALISVKYFGLCPLIQAIKNVRIQNSVSVVFDNRHDKT